MSFEADQLQRCEFYRPCAVGRLSDGSTKPVRPDTCEACGGDGWHGPSCLCPVFGEVEDDESEDS